MTAQPQGFWPDGSDENTFATEESWARESAAALAAANGNPISPVTDWPAEEDVASELGNHRDKLATGTDASAPAVPAAQPARSAQPDTIAQSNNVAQPNTVADRNPYAEDTTLAEDAPYPWLADDDELEPTRPGRLALGMAVLAAERLSPGGPGAAFVTGLGLAVRTAADVSTLARRAIRRPAEVAAVTTAFASILPGADVPRRLVERPRALLRRVTDSARLRGEAAIAASRADASRFLRSNVTDGIGWAQAKVVPQVVDGLVPHLVDQVVPRLIEGAMPEIRTRVLPIVIEDLTKDPRVRDLVVEQGRGVVGEAAQQLRATSATADDRLESAFRKLVRSPMAAEEAESPQPPLDRG